MVIYEFMCLLQLNLNFGWITYQSVGLNLTYILIGEHK